MPRLNIYLPEDVFELANRWRDAKNLSEICAKAIKDELGAEEEERAYSRVLEKVRPHTELELAILQRFSLADIRIAETPTDAKLLRDAIARTAASYLDANFCDDAVIGIAGGRQTWSVVQHLSPRR